MRSIYILKKTEETVTCALISVMSDRKISMMNVREISTMNGRKISTMNDMRWVIGSDQ